MPGSRSFALLATSSLSSKETRTPLSWKVYRASFWRSPMSALMSPGRLPASLACSWLAAAGPARLGRGQLLTLRHRNPVRKAPALNFLEGPQESTRGSREHRRRVGHHGLRCGVARRDPREGTSRTVSSDRPMHRPDGRPIIRVHPQSDGRQFSRRKPNRPMAKRSLSRAGWRSRP